MASTADRVFVHKPQVWSFRVQLEKHSNQSFIDSSLLWIFGVCRIFFRFLFPHDIYSLNFICLAWRFICDITLLEGVQVIQDHGNLFILPPRYSSRSYRFVATDGWEAAYDLLFAGYTSMWLTRINWKLRGRNNTALKNSRTVWTFAFNASYNILASCDVKLCCPLLSCR